MLEDAPELTQTATTMIVIVSPVCGWKEAGVSWNKTEWGQGHQGQDEWWLFKVKTKELEKCCEYPLDCKLHGAGDYVWFCCVRGSWEAPARPGHRMEACVSPSGRDCCLLLVHRPVSPQEQPSREERSLPKVLFPPQLQPSNKFGQLWRAILRSRALWGARWGLGWHHINLQLLPLPRSAFLTYGCWTWKLFSVNLPVNLCFTVRFLGSSS